MKGRELIIRVFGILLFLMGVVAALLGPAEIFCFYLFSKGGMFHYEGFRFGSFMFGTIAAQVLGYYFIASILVPVGFGTMRLKKWSHHFMLALVQFWIIGGLPLIAAFLFVLISSKSLTYFILILIGILLLVSYPILPFIVIHFYKSQKTFLIFEKHASTTTWIETIPIPILSLSILFIFFIIILHVQIFFNGIFPIFGTWASGLTGILMIDLCIILLLAILFGVVKIRKWAWLSALIYFCTLTLSYIITLTTSSWPKIISVLNLPAYEIDILQKIHLHGYHIAILSGIPFLFTIILIFRAKSCFIKLS